VMMQFKGCLRKCLFFAMAVSAEFMPQWVCSNPGPGSGRLHIHSGSRLWLPASLYLLHPCSRVRGAFLLSQNKSYFRRHPKIKLLLNSLLTSLLLFSVFPVWAELASQKDCQALEIVSGEVDSPSKYADALLWKVSKDNKRASYIFGTIHVSDPKIVTLPQEVSSALNNADIFVMEALPVPDEALKLSQMMFFSDGSTLKNFIDDELFEKTATILRDYQLPTEAVMVMKPWAAFLIMNYPAGEGLPLDLQLLQTAQQNGAEVHGLESLSEQGDIFSTIDFDDQVKLLLDTICHYDVVKSDFEKMKSLYLERNLRGLFKQSNQYSFSKEPVYKDLMQRLLVDRNYTMTERMQDILDKGNAFIAIGAMHLPGEEGVLSLLGKQGYKIHSIY